VAATFVVPKHQQIYRLMHDTCIPESSQARLGYRGNSSSSFKVVVDCSRILMHSIQRKIIYLSLYSDSLPDRRRSAAAAATGQPYQGCSLQPHSDLAPAAAAAAACLAQLASSAAQLAAAQRATPYLDPLSFCCMTCAPRSFFHGEGHM